MKRIINSKRLQRQGRYVFYFIVALVFMFSVGGKTSALSDEQKKVLQSGVYYFNTAPDDVCTNASTAGSNGGSLDSLLQAIAAHESGGNPTAVNGAGAYGKYQFQNATWQSSARNFYPPAQQYARADQAPEPAQDAVEYLRFIPIYNQVQGDLFAVAIANYYPADVLIAHANHNDPRLDYRPPGNPESIKEYANNVLNIISSGMYKGVALKNIPLKYNQAPDFATWLAKVGGTPTGSATIPQTISDTTAPCGLSNGATANNIVQTALKFSWPENHGPTPKPEYAAAIQQFNPGAPFGGADCGAFVATVMRASGADPNYPPAGTINQEKYVFDHPEKYDLQFGITSTADLQPGDILIVNEGAHLDSGGKLVVPSTGNAGSGHTVIYVGPQPPNNYNEASASFRTRAANLGTLALNDGRGLYMRARLKQ